MVNARTCLILAVATAMTSAVAVADTDPDADPYQRPDDAWISISGTVADPTAESFRLDYGDGVITVDVNDWDNYGDAYTLVEGDAVTVYGEVDDDLFERTTIEAASVYVEDLNTYFYASADDQEDTSGWVVAAPVVVGDTTLRGSVDDVDAAEDEFTIDTGTTAVTVETDAMVYDPLDSVGFQQLEAGERVSVTGSIDADFFEGLVFEARSVISLSDADAPATAAQDPFSIDPLP